MNSVGAGQLSRYCGKRFGDRISVEARYSAPVQTGLLPTSLLYNSFAVNSGSKEAGA